MPPPSVANGLVGLIQALWKIVQACQNTWRNHAQCSNMSSLPEIYKTGIQWLIFKLNLLRYNPYTNNMINSVVFWLNSTFSTILFLHFPAHSLGWCSTASQCNWAILGGWFQFLPYRGSWSSYFSMRLILSHEVSRLLIYDFRLENLHPRNSTYDRHVEYHSLSFIDIQKCPSSHLFERIIVHWHKAGLQLLCMEI